MIIRSSLFDRLNTTLSIVEASQQPQAL